MMSELKYPIIAKYPKGNERKYNTDNPTPTEPIQIISKEKKTDDDKRSIPLS
jgi:hypothetical protein